MGPTSIPRRIAAPAMACSLFALAATSPALATMKGGGKMNPPADRPTKLPSMPPVEPAAKPAANPTK